ncbi:MAG: hypothetical protein A2X05_10330 [Bacteroidetes bacterium GWE2_41_25]|nr:MAG: hypothetical protein A2X03_17710 [Bacteroidetes bacterium GWA2_40_15]OFX86126.1 MAG: hypothetical protein A2X06_16745 [Bacteroidetes bacterium GWC2_40_22]OFY12755.1 MAG: hypothetical protein A2X05_10330 [Bacteroidetes bacterium GWE2_41_25]OFY59225.1 MAG: hypothetical protein A2X04_09935 [Bacteroidetes bacterium GWF2_41_9]HAM10584.1 hypothetical protein [Bacteroidales bacterium]
MLVKRFPESIEEYIIGYPPEIRERLKKIRSIIRKAAPEAEEKISYGMPAFTHNGMLIYFAAHTKHIGLYPFSSAIVAFREELAEYKTAKGSIQFPNDKPLPLNLISQIVAFRVEENKIMAELKTGLKKNKKK